MKKKWLVLCIDGTWNRDDEATGAIPTNVARIRRLLLDVDGKQRVLYLPGVGTEMGFDRIYGGIWGGRTRHRVCEGYKFLCENYEPGDRIALFGFSRGAFAVRAIIGMLIVIGVLSRPYLERVDEAFAIYRSFHETNRYDRIDNFKRETTPYFSDIGFVGVWDTVIRHGPIVSFFGHIFSLISGRSFGLFDQLIPRNVRNFRHALALDETRAMFLPWRAQSALEQYEYEIIDQVVKEVWFAGSHSDVGGGNRNTSLPDISLRWMVQEAIEAELEFREVPAVAAEAAFSNITEMNRGAWRLLWPRPRVVALDDQLHSSVYERAARLDYRPSAALPPGLDADLSGIPGTQVQSDSPRVGAAGRPSAEG